MCVHTCRRLFLPRQSWCEECIADEASEMDRLHESWKARFPVTLVINQESETNHYGGSHSGSSSDLSR